MNIYLTKTNTNINDDNKQCNFKENNNELKIITMKLNNDDILDILGMPTNKIPLEQRLQYDFTPIVLNNLLKSKKRKYRKRRKTKKNVK